MSTVLSPPRQQQRATLSRLAQPVQKVLHNGTVRGVAVLTTGTMGAHLLVMIAAPVLTRLYTPADFGVLSAFVALVGLLTTIGCLGYERSIPLPAEENDALSLVGLCGLILIVNVIGIFLGIQLGGARLLTPFAGEGLGRYAWLIAPACLFISLYEALTYYTTRIKAFSCLAWTKIYQGAGMVGCQIGWGLLQGSTLGLLLGDLAGRALGVSALARPIAQALRRDLRLLSPQALKRVAIRYWRFPVLTLPSTLLNRTAFHLPKLIMAGVFTPSLLGCLMLADSVLHAPSSLLGQNLARVYIGEFSERRRTRPESCGAFFRKFAGWLCLLALLPMGVIYLWGPICFRWIFGNDWEMAGYLARVLAPAVLLQFVMSPISPTLFLSERQGLQLAWDAFYSMLGCGSVATAALLQWEPTEIVGVYAGSQGLAYVVQGILLVAATRDKTSLRTLPLDSIPKSPKGQPYGRN